jgi:DNA-binding LytR/AlgR family response regulator
MPDRPRILISRPRTLVHLRDIILVTGHSNYSLVGFADGSVRVVALTLREVSERLPGLVRIHRHYLVNPQYVQAVRTTGVGKSGELILTTGEVLPVARRRKHQVRIDILLIKKNGTKTSGPQ